MARTLHAHGSTGGAEQRRFYSVAEVARMFGMSTMTLYRAIADGDFPAVKIRGRVIVPAKALDAMVDAATDTQAMVYPEDYVVPTNVA